MKITCLKTILTFAFLLLPAILQAQVIDDSATRVQTTLDPGLKRLGTLTPKNVRQIGSSRWSLGCETIDREYADYNSYKEYLVPLGIKRIRLQGGWARTEKTPGIYDFAWLDQIVNDALARGLQPWLETDYGNPIYPGAGGSTLNGGFPTSPEGLAAWDRWVEAMAVHFQGRVRDWSMWNEPEGNPDHTPQKIAEFNIRTAEIVKRVIPDARIGGLVIGRARPEIVEPYLQTLADRGKLDLFHWVIYHAYTRNPDDAYPSVLATEAIVRRLAPSLRLFQGEAGVQSEFYTAGALSKYPWTELTQAKWAARRMLGDLGHGVDSSVFTAADLDYRTTSFHNGLVRYGLIKTAGAVDGFRVLKVKTAYYAVQNVVSVFNDTLERIPDYPCEAQCPKPLAVFGHKDVGSGQQVCVFWDKSSVPLNNNDTVSATLTLTGATFTDPVWVDTITGGIFEIPKEKMSVDGQRVTFKDIPVYDAPTFITDRSLLK